MQIQPQLLQNDTGIKETVSAERGAFSSPPTETAELLTAAVQDRRAPRRARVALGAELLQQLRELSPANKTMV